MKRITMMLALAATLAMMTMPARGTEITNDISGVLSGFGADVGVGEVTGFVTFDDATGAPEFPGQQRFVLSDFEVAFSNGPTLRPASPELFDPLRPEIVVDLASGDLVAFDLSALFLVGFGLIDPVDLFFDPFATTFAFFNVTGSVVAQGNVSFATTATVSEPATIALLALALSTAGWRRQRR